MSTSSETIPGLKQRKVFKIIVLGDSGVGKTCLTYRFCEGQFLDKSEATIGVDFRERTVKIRNEEIKVTCSFSLSSLLYRKNIVKNVFSSLFYFTI